MSSIKSLYEIHGVVNTDKNVIENLNNLCTAAGAWLTYDIGQGQWAVVINKAGSSVASFDDTNIIGSINISGTGIYELYNKVSVEFPHKDLKDATDYVELTIPSGDRFPNELDNTLNIKLDVINDPIQAQAIGGRELKQSRVDKVIEFRTDFTYIGLKGGDIIDVTNEMYGYTNKLFRIISIEEDDSEEFIISIKALEYDANVYDITDLSGGLVRTDRSQQTGITPKNVNTAIQASNDLSTGEQLSRLLIANGAASLLGSLFKRILGTNTFGPSEQGKTLDKLLRGMKKPDLTSINVPSEACEGDDIVIIVDGGCEGACFLDMPNFEYDYEISGIFEEDIETLTINGTSVDVALTGKIEVQSGSAEMIIKAADTAGGSSSQTMSITIGGINDSCTIYKNNNTTYSTDVDDDIITEGQTAVITITTTNVDDGTSVPYAITGEGTSRVSSPSLTGNVTINSNTASVSIVTTNDSVYTGDQTITFTLDPDSYGGCHGTWDLSSTITILDNDPGYALTASQYSVSEGGSFTVRLDTSNVTNGTTVPYTITGVSSSDINGASLTGSFTVNSNYATLAVNVSMDGVNEGDETFVLTLNGITPIKSVSVLITGDGDYQRQYVLTPVVWGGTYDGIDNQLKAVYIQRSAYLPIPFPGESTVNIPTALSVTKGSSSTISVVSTRAIASSATIGGTAIEVITSFNSVSPQGAITGTRTTVYGYY